MAGERYDVVILGGALAGASTALLARRRFPDRSVLIVEKSPAFDRKVGESTVEASSYFLTRVLRLHDHLAREQLPKHGLRYWFHHGGVDRVRQASEVGPNQLPRLAGFQLDRSVLDEHVLRLAVDAGADLLRPARVAGLELPEESGRDESVVRVEVEGKTREIRAGWLVDASGRAAILARPRGMVHPIEDHPVSSVWARFRGVKDIDGLEVAGDDPDHEFVRSCAVSRRLCTNHFNGWGYWIWFIPLPGGETSIGVVWDRRLVQPAGGTPRERLRAILDANPLTRELTAGAKPVDGDCRTLATLPYLVDRVAGRGWSLVGDAAGFIDPLYSPGIDQLSFSVSWTTELLEQSNLAAAEFEETLSDHNRRYSRFMNGYFNAIYRDKYTILGDYDTMTASFLVETALYYIVLIMKLYRGSSRQLLEPPFYKDMSEPGIAAISLFRKRLVAIARRRMKLGTYGIRNRGRRPNLSGYSLGLSTFTMFLRGLGHWIRAEAEHAWSYVSRPRRMRARMPISFPAPPDPSVPA